MADDKDQKKGNEVYKDDVDDSSFNQKPSLKMNLSIRANIHKFTVLGVIIFLVLTAISSIPAQGLRIYDILGKPEVSKATSKWWLNILSYRISDSTMTLPLYIILGAAILMILYYIIDAKMTEYSINFRYIEIKKGVFNRTFDTIDLVLVKDQVLERPFIFRILGISRLIILSNDKSTPELKISAVDANKANSFLDFIRQNAYQNSTEYWIAKDRRRRNEKPDKGSDSRGVLNVDDGGDRGDEGDKT